MCSSGRFSASEMVSRASQVGPKTEQIWVAPRLEISDIEAIIIEWEKDPNKDIGFNILSIFHYDKDVKVLTCQSLEQVP